MKECTGGVGECWDLNFIRRGKSKPAFIEDKRRGWAELWLRGFSGDRRQETPHSVGPTVTFAKRKTLLNTIVSLKKKKKRKINRTPHELRKPVLALREMCMMK